MFTYLVYTHSEYSDILDIHLKRLNKHYPEIKPLIATNSRNYILNKYDNINEDQIYLYDTSKPFGERLNSVLSKIETEYILLSFDNDILVENVVSEKINEIVNTMKNENIDQIRLIVGGIDNPVFTDKLNTNKGSYFFSVSPTIWNIKTLLDITYTFKDINYRSFESLNIQNYVSKFNNTYISSSKDIKYTNEGHYLSYYFPICHCIGNGKWRNYSPMNIMYINQISCEYDIDLSIRGNWNDKCANDATVKRDNNLIR
jgi:hypothetical protein